MDLRSAAIFVTEARYLWNFESGKGITRDFSGSGIFFETDRSFSPGQPIEFILVLGHIDPERPVRLKCQGIIVRVEESRPMIGVAASINSYTFAEAAQQLSTH